MSADYDWDWVHCKPLKVWFSLRAISHGHKYSLQVLSCESSVASTSEYSQWVPFILMRVNSKVGNCLCVIFVAIFVGNFFCKYIFLQWLWLSNEDTLFWCGDCYWRNDTYTWETATVTWRCYYWDTEAVLFLWRYEPVRRTGKQFFARIIRLTVQKFQLFWVIFCIIIFSLNYGTF